MKHQVFIAIFLSLGICTAQAQCPRYRVKIFTDISPHAAGLTKITKEYVEALGGMNNGNTPGPLAHGHRSVSELINNSVTFFI